MIKHKYAATGWIQDHCEYGCAIQHKELSSYLSGCYINKRKGCSHKKVINLQPSKDAPFFLGATRQKHGKKAKMKQGGMHPVSQNGGSISVFLSVKTIVYISVA